MLATRGIIVLALVSLCMSCIDNTYDLNGGVSTDVYIPGNKLSLPIGDLKPYTLDSLLTLDDGWLHVEDGVYGLRYSDTLTPVTIPLDTLSIPVDPLTFDMTYAINKAELTELELPVVEKQWDIDLGLISKEEIDEKLPVLEENALFAFSDVDFAAFILAVQKAGLAEQEFKNLTASVSKEERTILCDFAYELPEEIKSIHSIAIGERGAATAGEGKTLTVEVVHPTKLAGMEKTIDFEIEFPSNYELGLAADAEQASCYSLQTGAAGYHNILRVKGLKGTGEVTPVRFKAISMNNLADRITEKDGVRSITLHEEAKYSLTYAVKGDLMISAKDSPEDYRIGLRMQEAIGIDDAEIELNDMQGSFEKEEISFNTVVDGLEYVDSIGVITFDQAQSHILLTVTTDKSMENVPVRLTSPVTVQLPDGFHLELVGNYPGVRWDGVQGALVIEDVTQLFNCTYEFAVQSVDVRKKVVDGSVELGGMLTVSVPDDTWKLQGNVVTLSSALDLLGERKVSLSIPASKIVVDDLTVTTSRFCESLTDTIDFTIDVPFDGLIAKAYTLWPVEDMVLDLSVALRGLESLKTEADFELSLDYPDYICLESDDPDITIKDGRLTMNTRYQPQQESLQKKLKLTHLDFTRLPEGSLSPVEENGETRLKLSDHFLLNGEVTVDETDVSLQSLADELSLHAEATFSNFIVKTFEGVIDYAVDPIDLTVDLSGEELVQALQEGETSIIFSESQLFVTMDNAIGVPVLADLTLVGYDANGQEITSSAVSVKDVRIQPAAYDATSHAVTPVTTKLLFTSEENVQMEGYETIVVPNLTHLLQTIPNSVHLTLTPRIDQRATHYIDLSAPLTFGGSYSVAVPMKFDALNLRYEMPGKGLEVSLGDYSENLSNATATLKMKARNTLPIGLTLHFQPLDVDGNVLDEVQISTLELAAGDGAAISRDATPQEVALTISSASCDLSRWAYLRVAAEATADHTVGGVALRPEQGFLLTDIVLQVVADIHKE